MIYGFITTYRPGEFSWVDGVLNAPIYINTLEKDLINTMKHYNHDTEKVTL